MEDLNKKFAELNEVLNKNVNSDKYPGDAYIQKIIVDLGVNQMLELPKDVDLQDLQCEKCLSERLLTPVFGVVKEAKVKSESLKRYIGSTLIGYVFGARVINSNDLTQFDPIIDSFKMELYEHHGIDSPGAYNIVGETFLKVLPDKDGNYLRDTESSATYTMVLYSNCAFVPKVITKSKVNALDIKTRYDIVL